MFNKQDGYKNQFMLNGSFARQGYDWWWHSFTAVNEETGEEKPFFVEFFLCNPALGGDEAVLGQLQENSEAGRKPSYLCVKAGWWGKDHKQLHRFIPWSKVEVYKGAPYGIKAEDCEADDLHLKGSVTVTEEEAEQHPEWMCDAGSMSFDLTLDKQVAFNVGYGAGTLFRWLKAFEMYWHAEGMKTLYCGEVYMNGKRYVVKPENSFGYADKNWGRNFTSPWVWLSSCCLKSNITGRKLENSVFDIGGGRPKVFFVPLERKLLSAFWYEGIPYEFNFSKFWTFTGTKFTSKETEDAIWWHVRQENHSAVMDTIVKCKKEDMLLVNYESPDGMKRHNRLWNGGNGVGRIRLYSKTSSGLVLIDDITATHIGCEYGEYGD